MSEHRTPEVKTIISQLDKKIKEDEIKAYVDPVKAEEAKEKGNELFNKGKEINWLKIIHFLTIFNQIFVFFKAIMPKLLNIILKPLNVIQMSLNIIVIAPLVIPN